MSCDHQKVLILAGEGKWDEAHRMVQPHSDKISCMIHGYLHAVEGDMGNSAYWYRRAGEPTPAASLDEEYARLTALVSR